MHLHNAWYVAAWSHALLTGRLPARTIVGEPLLPWRTADGQPAAHEDRRVHRQAPHSPGRLEGDALRARDLPTLPLHMDAAWRHGRRIDLAALRSETRTTC